MTLTVEPLGEEHDLERFDCGHDELTEWLRRHARQATGHGTRTYLVVDEEGLIAGSFALAPHLVERDEAPKPIGRGGPRQTPAILLAKLALDRSRQGEGLGSELLVRALEHAVEAARLAGGKIVVVDEVDDETARFYEHHNFVPVPGNPRRLVQKLSTTATALGLPWP